MTENPSVTSFYGERKSLFYWWISAAKKRQIDLLFVIEILLSKTIFDKELNDAEN